MPSPSARPVQLHVMHDLGGGSEKWLREFVQADTGRTNLVLRSIWRGASAADALALYASALDEVPIRTWPLAVPIPAARTEDPSYRDALAGVVREFGVQGVIVSSLIGHSLEALSTGLPTLVVAHDYFPWAATVNVPAESVKGDPRLDHFPDVPPSEREALRERFVALLQQPGVVLVAPSRSVAERYRQSDARFGAVRIEIVGHGHAQLLPRARPAHLAADKRLRIVVAGQQSVAKGMDLLLASLGEISTFADLFLLGCGEAGEFFRYRSHVSVVSRYSEGELAQHVDHIRPHLGLLTSVVHETFGYALSELWMLGIPPVATAVGSFAERIVEGENGFLFEPDPRSMVATLRRLDFDRAAIERVRQALPSVELRTMAAMLADYHRLLPLDGSRGGVIPAASLPDAVAALHVATTANLAKQLKSASLQLSLVQEARHRQEVASAAERARLEERVALLSREVADRDATLQEQDRHLQSLLAQREVHEARLAQIAASTSWRVTLPLRLVGRGARKARILLSVMVALLKAPDTIPDKARRARAAWSRGGMLELKKALFDMQQGPPPGEPWRQYREAFVREVRPRIVEAVRGMGRRPLISILVPTYNPNKDMLRSMLDSVRAQLYGTWELCVVDDASTDPRVAETLQEYAGVDKRIKVRILEENRGVSHASNRALDMATGTFTMLLDHDDVLEEQALFRVAQSLIEDHPDFLYGDEVLVTPDGDTVRRYAFRPAFSLEYLRGHPYIVHPVGFRTELLRELGGFDESLRISQDYDLILRAVEKATTIVHVPEVLYRWRIHGASAGSARQAEVMATSRRVLDRHLERCGIAGHIEDGPSFNLFRPRYAVRDETRVAIIIPTKNHGDLVKQCIESIRDTVRGIAYDIVVVDHESDDRSTLDYLRALSAGGARVVRFTGPFNFSRINNWAVREVGDAYSHLLFCNNDIEAMTTGWLQHMVEIAQQPDVGAVGALLFYPDRRTIQHAGVCVGMFGAAEHYAKWLQYPGQSIEAGYSELLHVSHEVSAVTAACMLVSRESFEAVGGFDEELAVGFGDVDLCLRIGALGKRIVFCPQAALVHHESYTRGTSTTDPHPEDSARYRSKWESFLAAGDPFFSPSLSLKHPIWTLRHPLPAEFEIRRRVTRLEARATPGDAG